MSENFMSLGETIVEDLHLTDSEASGVDAAMSWLQMHQAQVPRLTMTEAELEEAVDASGSLKEFARRFGISVVPTAETPPATMTREEFRAAVSRVEGMVGDLTDVSAVCASFVIETGIVVVDPEPTPAEQMLADLEGMNGDGFLLHHRHREIVAAQLTALGWAKTTETTT